MLQHAVQLRLKVSISRAARSAHRETVTEAVNWILQPPLLQTQITESIVQTAFLIQFFVAA